MLDTVGPAGRVRSTRRSRLKENTRTGTLGMYPRVLGGIWNSNGRPIEAVSRSPGYVAATSQIPRRGIPAVLADVGPPPPLPSPPLLLPRRLTFSTTRYSTRDVPRHIPRISRDTRYCRRKYDPPRDCRRRRRCCRVVPQARRYHPRLCPAFGSRVSRRNRGGVDEVGNSTRARWEEEFLSSGYSGLSDSSVESPASPSCPGQGPRASSGPRCHASGPHGVGAARLSLPSLSFSPRTNERR